MKDKDFGKILIVDDLRVNRLVLAELFRQNYEILEAENGVEAIDILNEQEEEIVAVLLDVVMPRMNGFGVLDYMNSRKMLEYIPVLFVTADTTLDTAIKGFENGIVDMITKPMVNPVIVRKRVDNAIQLYEEKRRTSEDRTVRPLFHGGLSDYALEIFERERQKNQWFQEMSDEIIFDYDIVKDKIEFSEKFQEVFGEVENGSASEALMRGEYLAREEMLRIFRELDQLTPMNPVYCTKIVADTRKHKGECFELYVRAMWDNNKRDEHKRTGYIGKLVSVRKFQMETQQWRKKALRDYLTGVMNRQALWSRMEEQMQEEETDDFAVLFMDLDGFKQINDTRGHAAGDELLRKSAGLLLKNVRTSDFVARVGGDEFIVVLNGTKNVDVIKNKAEAIKSALCEQMEGDGVTCSIGISIYPDNGNDINGLIEKADKALYAAKKSGKNRYKFFAEELDEKKYESVWKQ